MSYTLVRSYELVIWILLLVLEYYVGVLARVVDKHQYA